MKKHIIILIALLLSAFSYADTYRKVTSQSEIVDGGEYFMVGENGDFHYFSGEFTNNKFYAISTDFTSDQYTGDVNKSGCPYTFKLEASESNQYFNIKLYNNEYLGYNNNNNNNNLITHLDKSILTNKSWDISINDEKKQLVAQILINSDFSNTKLSLGPSTGDKFFNMYTASNQKPTYLYKKVEDVTPSPTTQAVTITDAGWATYFNTDYDLDFSNTGAKAYRAKVSNDKQCIYLESVVKVPHGEGVIINYDGGGTINVPITTGVTQWAAADNDLICCTSAYTVTEGFRYYILMMPFAFYPVTTDTTDDNNVIPQGRCYIDLGSSSSSKPLSINPTLGTTTGINTIVTENSKTTYRNLLGIPVSANSPGIIIINGKKFVNRR